MFIYNDSNLFSLSLSASTFDGLDISRLTEHLHDRPSKWSVISRGALRSVLSRSWHTIIYDGILTTAELLDVIVSVYKFIFVILKKRNFLTKRQLY